MQRCWKWAKSIVKTEVILAWLLACSLDPMFTPLMITAPITHRSHGAGVTLSPFLTVLISFSQQPREQAAPCCHREESEAQDIVLGGARI